VAGKNKVENFTLSTAELPAVATFYRISNAASASWPFVRLSVWPDFFYQSVGPSISRLATGRLDRQSNPKKREKINKKR